MKFIKKFTCALLVILMGAYLFSGCTAHKYELVGIVLPGDSVITPLEKIEDEEIKQYIYENYQNNIYIDLDSRGTFSMGYSLTNNGLTVSYTQVGTYELNQDENIITFYTQTSSGEMSPSKQQYLNGKIVYFDGVVFLAFK